MLARILKAQGLPPVPERPTSWQTFLRAHWGAIAGRGFLHDGGLDLAGLGQVIPFGDRHLRRMIAEFVAHYHGERNHQGLDNEFIDGAPPVDSGHRICRRQRLGGLLNYYARAA